MKTLKQEEVVGILLDKISGRYLELFPKNNIFIYSSEAIATMLKERFVNIQEVDVRYDGDNKISVYIKEREASFMWCEEVQNGCYYMDENGLIFDNAPRFSNGVFLVFRGGISLEEGSLDYIGRTIMTPENIKMLNIFKSRIEKIIFKHFKQEWKISSFLISDGGDIVARLDNGQEGEWELMIAPRTEEKYSFRGGEQPRGLLREEQEGEWFGFGGDLQAAEENFDVTIGSQAFKEHVNNSYKSLADLEYIDLRFDKKIFYKFKI
jgi:hypothetical protein